MIQESLSLTSQNLTFTHSQSKIGRVYLSLNQPGSFDALHDDCRKHEILTRISIEAVVDVGTTCPFGLLCCLPETTLPRMNV